MLDEMNIPQWLLEDGLAHVVTQLSLLDESADERSMWEHFVTLFLQRINHICYPRNISIVCTAFITLNRPEWLAEVLKKGANPTIEGLQLRQTQNVLVAFTLALQKYLFDGNPDHIRVLFTHTRTEFLAHSIAKLSPAEKQQIQNEILFQPWIALRIAHLVQNGDRECAMELFYLLRRPQHGYFAFDMRKILQHTNGKHLLCIVLEKNWHEFFDKFLPYSGPEAKLAALAWAVNTGDIAIAQTLISRCEGRYHYPCYDNRTNNLYLLTELQRQGQGDTFLHRTIRLQNFPMMQLLLAQDPHIDLAATNKQGITACHLLCDLAQEEDFPDEDRQKFLEMLRYFEKDERLSEEDREYLTRVLHPVFPSHQRLFARRHLPASQAPARSLVLGGATRAVQVAAQRGSGLFAVRRSRKKTMPELGYRVERSPTPPSPSSS